MEGYITGVVGWVITNKDMLFSGAGVAIIACVGRIFWKKSSTSLKQNIQSGDGSKNFQAGRDMTVTTEKAARNVDDE